MLPRPADKSFASLGYGLSGTVLEVAGDVRDIAPGDAVACAGSQCAFHAEQVAVPRSLAAPCRRSCRWTGGLRYPRRHFHRITAPHGLFVRRNGGCLRRWCARGLAVQLAVASGMYVACVDPNPARLAVAARYGALTAAPGDGADLAEGLLARTDGFGADAAIIAVTTDGSDVIASALGLVRRGARVVLVGQLDVHVDRDRLFESGATIVTSSAYGPAATTRCTKSPTSTSRSTSSGGRKTGT